MQRFSISIDQLEKIIPIVIIGGSVILLLIVLLILGNNIWKSSNKVLSEVNISEFEVFDKISLQITSYSMFNLVVGIPFKAKVLINNSQLILLFRKRPLLFDVNIYLPLVLSSSKQKQDYEIRFISWNKTSILLKPHPKEFIKLRRVIYIKQNDKTDVERLRSILKNWC